MVLQVQAHCLVMEIPSCIGAVAEQPTISYAHKEQVHPYHMDAATDPNCISWGICDLSSSFSNFLLLSHPRSLYCSSCCRCLCYTDKFVTMLAVKERTLEPLPRKQNSDRRATATTTSAATANVQTITSSDPQSSTHAYATDLQKGIPRSQPLSQAST